MRAAATLPGMAQALPELAEDQASEILRTLGYEPGDCPERTDDHVAYHLGAVIAVAQAQLQAHLARVGDLEHLSATRGYHDAYSKVFDDPCPCGEFD